MWWALQTVTTVGYGDVTSTKPIGKIVASFVMLEGIAYLALVTAAVSSTFVARAAAERGLAAEAEFDHVEVIDRAARSHRGNAGTSGRPKLIVGS